jgi:hypothetical protein
VGASSDGSGRAGASVAATSGYVALLVSQGGPVVNRRLEHGRGPGHGRGAGRPRRARAAGQRRHPVDHHRPAARPARRRPTLTARPRIGAGGRRGRHGRHPHPGPAPRPRPAAAGQGRAGRRPASAARDRRRRPLPHACDPVASDRTDRHRRQTHAWEQQALDELRQGDPARAVAAYQQLHATADDGSPLVLPRRYLQDGHLAHGYAIPATRPRA